MKIARPDGKRVPVLYTDLDSTIRKGYDELGRWVNGPEDVEVFPEVPAILAGYKAAGWRIVGVTNQGGVSLGHLSFEAMREAVYETQNQCGGVYDRITACIHHPDVDDPEFAVCWCRKPRIGGVINVVADMGRQHPNELYPPHMALFVGDREEDRECAEGLNVAFMDAVEWRVGGWRRALDGQHYAEVERVEG